jgi:hypothetical protein
MDCPKFWPRYTDRRVRTSSVAKVCKIKHVNQTYYSISGIGDQAIYNAVKKILLGCKTINEGAKACSNKMVVYFDSLLEIARLSDLEFFKNSFPTRLVSKIAFYGWENGKPMAIFDVFRLTTSLNEPVNVACDYYPDAILTSNPAYLEYSLGRDNAIKNYPKLEKDKLLLMHELKNSVEFLINLEIKEDSSEVGPPINIIKIDKNGATWLSNKGKCPI